MTIIKNETKEIQNISLSLSTGKGAEVFSLQPNEKKTVNRKEGKTFLLKIDGGFEGYIADEPISILSKDKIINTDGLIPSIVKKTKLNSWMIIIVIIILLFSLKLFRG